MAEKPCAPGTAPTGMVGALPLQSEPGERWAAPHRRRPGGPPRGELRSGQLQVVGVDVAGVERRAAPIDRAWLDSY